MLAQVMFRVGSSPLTFAQGFFGWQLLLPLVSAHFPGASVQCSVFVFVWACDFAWFGTVLPQVHMQLSSCTNFYAFFFVLFSSAQCRKFTFGIDMHMLQSETTF